MRLSDAKKILSGELRVDSTITTVVPCKNKSNKCDCGNCGQVYVELSQSDMQFALRQLALKTEREAKARK